MPPDQNQNINLLPGDLRRKREVIKKVIADDVVTYTQPQNGQANKPPQEKRGLISFWGRKGGNVFKKSTGNGLRISGEKFTPSAKPRNGKGAQNPPRPNFLSQRAVPNPPAKNGNNNNKEIKPEAKEVKKEAGPKKPSWWQRLFAKKVAAKKPEPVQIPPVKIEPKPVEELVKPKIEEPKEEPEPEAKKELIPEAPKDLPEPEPPKTEPAGPITPPENGKNNGFIPAQSGAAGNEYDVNLLSKEYAEVFKVKNQKSVLLLWSISALIVVILAYLGIHLYQLKKSANIRKASQINTELERTIATYSSLEQEDALLLQKISSLKTLLGNHISLNKFLGLLEQATTPEVTYTAIAASREGLVTITALATDFTSLGRQLSILQEHTDWIQEAQITAAQLSKDNQSKTRGVEFDLLLKVDQSVFGEPETTTP